MREDELRDTIARIRVVVEQTRRTMQSLEAALRAQRGSLDDGVLQRMRRGIAGRSVVRGDTGRGEGIQ